MSKELFFLNIVVTILYLVNGDSLNYLEDVKHTARAMRIMTDMHRRLRRQAAIRMPNALGQKKFNPNLMWKKAFNKLKIINIMRNPKLYQGDVLFTKIQAEYMVQKTRMHLAQRGIRYPTISFENTTRVKRRVLTNKFFRWNMPIEIYIEPEVDKRVVDRALIEIQQYTCIRFKKVVPPLVGRPGIRFFKGTDCHSYVGRAYDDKFQEICIGNGCDRVSTIQHETLHALGVFHEQARPDRDKYITIVTNNISPNRLYNFDIIDKQDYDDYGLTYDYTSLMHYPINLFSVNNQPTTLPKDKNYILSIGTQEKLTYNDIKLINLHYCSKVCPKRISCANWGYQNPNNCNLCVCPPGFNGPNCGTVGVSSRNCGQTILRATEIIQELRPRGIGLCHFMIQGPVGTKIAYKFVEGEIYPRFNDYCTYENTIEIKYWKDKSVSGARFCVEPMNLPRFSFDHLLEIVYRSNETENYASIVFKIVKNF
ncbi:Astacin-like metalloendopeptidase [Strongyloides ratti]|uniref:Zinc metalloproteinase n=1 Tax=Strongyloides ratti TaxID=34506 RepID=A0A090LSM9_STRRB|nr:Astacin-like metalloendopeptidase [Strongyloides ratti]CEF70613.2 Astacin-like metalloendopeptidase [Strongyloides ratti]